MTTNPLFEPHLRSDQIINSIIQNIVVINQDGFIIYTNNQWNEFCNKNGGDIKKCGVGVNYFDVCRNSDKSVGVDEMSYVIRNLKLVLEGEKECFSYEYPCHSPDKKRWFFMNVTPLQHEKIKRKGAVIVHEDITVKKLGEEQIIYQERLSAVGQLVATIAHEIKNPLTTLKGFWTLFSQHTNHTLQTYSDVINQEIQAIEDVVSKFMILADPAYEEIEEVNIIDLLQHVIKIMECDTSKYILIILYDVRKNGLFVACNKNQLIHAFKNIISNAIHSMPDGGKLTIQVQTHDKDVVIEFIDEGCGIPDDFLAKLGEPFYLINKKGSGIGLMLVFQIINKHKGMVSIESRENHGTKVKVMLPLICTKPLGTKIH